MKNYIQPGDVITVTAPATVASGAGVLIGSLFGIAAGDAETGEPLDLATRGVFTMPKESAHVISVGEPVYFDDAAGDVGEEDTAHLARIGVAVEAAGNGATSVAVRLDG